ncbi:hypothetical protein ACHAXR_013550 [Thalassiosira sp. AJA248-18]
MDTDRYDTYVACCNIQNPTVGVAGCDWLKDVCDDAETSSPITPPATSPPTTPPTPSPTRAPYAGTASPTICEDAGWYLNTNDVCANFPATAPVGAPAYPRLLDCCKENSSVTGYNGFDIQTCNYFDLCKPTHQPTKKPTVSPTKEPTKFPSKSPTEEPTKFPSKSPTKIPSKSPTVEPSWSPTLYPTLYPTLSPTLYPTLVRDTQFLNIFLLQNTTHSSFFVRMLYYVTSLGWIIYCTRRRR